MLIHKQRQIVPAQQRIIQEVREHQAIVEEKERIGYGAEDLLTHVQQKSWIVKVTLQY